MQPRFRLLDRNVERGSGWKTPRSKKHAMFMAIKKWEAVIRFLRRGKAVESEGGSDTCALCTRYRFTAHHQCHGCPVYEHTGKAYCETTPFLNWMMAIEANSHKQKLMAAREELRFLRLLNDKLSS